MINSSDSQTLKNWAKAEGEKKMTTYKEIKDLIQKKYDDFLRDYAFFAFSNEQFEEGKKKLNVGPDNKVVKLYGGGFLLASKVDDFKKLVKECDDIKKQYNKDKKQLKQAIMYELANHEYHIREDLTDTLEALNISEDEAQQPEMKKLIKETTKEYMNKIMESYNL